MINGRKVYPVIDIEYGNLIFIDIIFVLVRLTHFPSRKNRIAIISM